MLKRPAGARYILQKWVIGLSKVALFLRFFHTRSSFIHTFVYYPPTHTKLRFSEPTQLILRSLLEIIRKKSMIQNTLKVFLCFTGFIWRSCACVGLATYGCKVAAWVNRKSCLSLTFGRINGNRRAVESFLTSPVAVTKHGACAECDQRNAETRR